MDLAALLDAAPAALVVVAQDGTVRFANPAAKTLLGQPSPHPPDRLLRWADTEPARSAAPAWRRASADLPGGGTRQVEAIHFTYDDGGERVTAYVVRETGGDADGGAADLRPRMDRLIRAAAHDLHEPLRMVGAYTALLERRYADRLDADGLQFLAYAADGARRMEVVVDALVTLARLWSQPPRVEPCDADACAADAVASLSAQIEARGAEVRVDGLPKVTADPRRLTQLFRQLVDNALKFSKTPPRVHVGASREDRAWRFTVADDGIGIDEQDLERVFEPFQRLHPVGAYAGAGVGLAVCREIVTSHGGAIWIDAATGGGARVHFTIPHEGGAADGPAREEVVE